MEHMNSGRFRMKQLLVRAAALLAGLVFLVTAFAQTASAATITMAPFDNGACFSGHAWSVTQCWDLGRAPITGDDVVMNGAVGPASPVSTYDLSSTVQLHSTTILKGGGSFQID